MTHPSTAARAFSAPETVSQSPAATSADGTVSFNFQCFGLDFRAWTQASAAGSTLFLCCEVGALPYTAENRDARRNALILLSHAGDIDGAQLLLTDFSRVSVMASAPVRAGEDAVGLFARAAVLAIATAPFIELAVQCLSGAEFSAGD
tara:strand:- start:86 stop:529 length:444 start_codon:yes stop_codon:yes gene_type:complete